MSIPGGIASTLASQVGGVEYKCHLWNILFYNYYQVSVFEPFFSIFLTYTERKCKFPTCPCVTSAKRMDDSSKVLTLSSVGKAYDVRISYSGEILFQLCPSVIHMHACPPVFGFRT